jgi:hypothetical protein
MEIASPYFKKSHSLITQGTTIFFDTSLQSPYYCIEPDYNIIQKNSVVKQPKTPSSYQ